jgi:hypothetical protein
MYKKEGVFVRIEGQIERRVFVCSRVSRGGKKGEALDTDKKA